MSEKLLEISGLSVCYEGEQILNNICFSVEKGETVGSPAVGMLLVMRWPRRDTPHESGSHIPP